MNAKIIRLTCLSLGAMVGSIACAYDAVEIANNAPFNVPATVDRPIVKFSDRTATTAIAGDVAWSALTWGEGGAPTNGDNANIAVTADATLTLDAAVSLAQVRFEIAEGRTLTLGGSGLTADGISIVGGRLKVTTANGITGTISGNGTAIYSGVFPSGAVWTHETWSGTLWLDNQTCNGVDVSLLGNRNSTLKMSKVAGYSNTAAQAAATVTMAGALEISATDPNGAAVEYGFKISNGWSSATTVFGSLKGDGRLQSAIYATQAYKFLDGAEFTGVIDATGAMRNNAYQSAKFVFGTSAGASRKITIDDGYTANMAQNWIAPGGIIVEGRLNVAETINSTASVSGLGIITFSGVAENTPRIAGLTVGESDTGWRGIVEIPNLNQGSKRTQLYFEGWGNQYSVIVLYGLTGTAIWRSAGDAIADVAIEGDVEINSGSYNAQYRWNTLLGFGNLTLKSWNNDNSAPAHFFNNILDYTGKLTTWLPITINNISNTGTIDNNVVMQAETKGNHGEFFLDSTTILDTPEYKVAYSEERGGIYWLDKDYIEEPTTANVANRFVLPYAVLNADYTLTGAGGVTGILDMMAGGRLIYNPTKTPIKLPRLPLFPVFEERGVLAPTGFENVPCGKLTLMTYNGSLADYMWYMEDPTQIVDASMLGGNVDSVEEILAPDGVNHQLVLKWGGYDTNAIDVKIMPLGDSITDGSADSGAYAGEQWENNPNYRIPLMQKLAANGYRPVSLGIRETAYTSRYGTDSAGVIADENYRWHSGVSGERIRASNNRGGLRESVDTMLECSGNPDIVTLKIGTNDYGSDRNYMFNAWSNVVWRILDARPNVKVVCASILNRNGDANQVDEYNALIRAQIEKSANEAGAFPANRVFFCDLNAACPRTVGGQYTGYFCNAGDLHPNWIGHDLTSDAWLAAVKTAIAAPTAEPFAPNTKLGAEANVPAEYREGFTHVYTLAPTPKAYYAKDSAVPYTYVNSEAAATGYDKVAYYVELKGRRSGNVRFVWADMDAFSANGAIAAMGVPTSYSKWGTVDNLHVYSNDAGIRKIAPNENGVTGWMQFTKGGASTAATAGGPAEIMSGKYDCCDTLGESGTYGIMQLHRVFAEPAPDQCAAETLFAFNRWGTNDGTYNEIGIGDFANHGAFTGGNGTESENYIFTYNYDTVNESAYDVVSIEIWGRPEAASSNNRLADDLIWLPVGDSITEGEQYMGHENQGDVNTRGGYRYQVWKQLEAGGQGVRTVGFRTGHSGTVEDPATCKWAYHSGQYGGVITHDNNGTHGAAGMNAENTLEVAGFPDLITMMIGVNDVSFTGATTTEIVDAYRNIYTTFDNMVKRYAAARPNSRIMLSTLFPAGGNRGYITGYNKLIRQKAEAKESPFDLANVEFVDVNLLGFNGQFTADDFKGDNLHPNENGAIKAANGFNSRIWSYIAELARTNAIPVAIDNATGDAVRVLFSKQLAADVNATLTLTDSAGVAHNFANPTVDGRRLVFALGSETLAGGAASASLASVTGTDGNGVALLTDYDCAACKTVIDIQGSGAAANVPAEFTRGFVKYQTIDIGVGSQYKTGIMKGDKYAGNGPTAATGLVQENLGDVKVRRVGYYMELKRPGKPAQFVWASMDASAFGNQLRNLGVPTVAVGNIKANVGNLQVYSNRPTVTNTAVTDGVVDNSQKGIVEFTPYDWSATDEANYVKDFNGKTGWNDTLGTSTLKGGMQLARVVDGYTPTSATDNYTKIAGEMIFAYNGFNSANDPSDIGIGSFSSHRADTAGNSSTPTLDWTDFVKQTEYKDFAINAYETRKIEIWVETAAIDPAAKTFYFGAGDYDVEIELLLPNYSASTITGDNPELVRFSNAAGNSFALLVNGANGTICLSVAGETVATAVPFAPNAADGRVTLRFENRNGSLRVYQNGTLVMTTDRNLPNGGSIAAIRVGDEMFALGGGQIDAVRTSALTPATLPGMRLVFNDEFNGDALDRTVWTPEVGLVRDENSRQIHLDDESVVAVADGALKLIAKHAPDTENPFYEEGGSDWRRNVRTADYAAGAIDSWGKFAFHYGHAEIRARYSVAQGACPALRLIGQNLGAVDSFGDLNAPENHWRAITSDDRSVGGEIDVDTIDDAQWHVYTLDVDENTVRIGCDGVTVLAKSQSELVDTVSGGHPFRDNHCYFVFDYALGVNSEAPPTDGAGYPLTMEVDYVRVYQNPASVNGVFYGASKLRGHATSSNDGGIYTFTKDDSLPIAYTIGSDSSFSTLTIEMVATLAAGESGALCGWKEGGNTVQLVYNAANNRFDVTCNGTQSHSGTVKSEPADVTKPHVYTVAITAQRTGVVVYQDGNVIVNAGNIYWSSAGNTIKNRFVVGAAVDFSQPLAGMKVDAIDWYFESANSDYSRVFSTYEMPENEQEVELGDFDLPTKIWLIGYSDSSHTLTIPSVVVNGQPLELDKAIEALRIYGDLPSGDNERDYEFQLTGIDPTTGTVDSRLSHGLVNGTLSLFGTTELGGEWTRVAVKPLAEADASSLSIAAAMAQGYRFFQLRLELGIVGIDD